MTPKLPLALLVLVVGGASSLAQDGSAVPPLAVSGQYRLARVDVGTTDATMDFTASLANPGDEEIRGTVVLRDPAVANRVFESFGVQTIPARGRLRLSAVVSVPVEIFESWSKGDAPGLFVNIEDDRGSVALHRVLLQRIPDRPPEG